MIEGIASLVTVLVLYAATIVAAPPQPVDKIRHEVNNHTLELHTLAERLNTQEELIQALREDVRRMTQESHELVKSGSNINQARIADLESSNQTLKELVTGYRESLNKCLNRIDTLEASLDQQSKNHHILEKSLVMLIETVGAELSTDTESATTYQVVAGDSLEKIARKLKTTIRALKERNGLDNDRIMVGQKLQIPRSSP